VKVPRLQIRLGHSGDQPHPEAIQRPLISINSGVVQKDIFTAMNNKRCSYYPCHSGNFKGLVALCQEPETKTKYIFLIIPQ
jgi:hypothetical protein